MATKIRNNAVKKRGMRGIDMKITGKFIACVLCFTFFAVMMMASQSMLNAREIKNPPKVVMGTIEEVTYSSIRVNGKDYDISNVPILSGGGIQCVERPIKTGRRVEIRFDGDKITSVIIKYKRNIDAVRGIQ